MNTIAALILTSGLIISLISLPLVFGRIPPNALYGIRTKAAFASDADWYRINCIGGRYFLVSGIIIFLVGMIGFFLPTSAVSHYGITAAIVIVSTALIPCFRLCLLKPAGVSRNA